MIDALIGLGYIGLLIACFISATLFPFSSDVVVAALIVAKVDPYICLLVATLGGWLGGIFNYYLGRLGKEEWIRKYSRVREERLLKVKAWMQGKGSYMAFFSWFPIIGSLLVVSLGYLRVNKYTVALFLLIGMFARYFVVIALTLMGMQVLF